jgi:RNA polymerase sigma-70 factor (ECF subfamily)
VSVPAANLQEMYAAYGRDVYRFALYLSGDRTIAEDLTSETFLRAMTTPGAVRWATAKAYLLATARNLNLERLRRGGRSEELASDPAQPAGFDRRMEARHELGRVQEGISALPEPERSALLLRSLHGTSYGEIGQILGLTAVAARVKVHRARQKLLVIRKGGSTR